MQGPTHASPGHPRAAELRQIRATQTYPPRDSQTHRIPAADFAALRRARSGSAPANTTPAASISSRNTNNRSINRPKNISKPQPQKKSTSRQIQPRSRTHDGEPPASSSRRLFFFFFFAGPNPPPHRTRDQERRLRTIQSGDRYRCTAGRKAPPRPIRRQDLQGSNQTKGAGGQ